MLRNNKFLSLGLSCIAPSLLFGAASKTAEKPKEFVKPNILFLYCDDLGLGDVGAYGAKKVATPNIDRLAREGILFNDGHSTSATCSPSRFSMFTGVQAFRNKVDILPGDAPLLIDTEILTLPKMLQKAGYETAVVGKWHLGLGRGDVNWNREISPGPREIGFDYSFLIPATGDRVPCVYVENQKVVNLDPNDPISVSFKKQFDGILTGKNSRNLLKFDYVDNMGHDESIVNGISRMGFMTGGKSALWVDEDMADVLTDKAQKFILANKEKPFFLYYAFHDIHVPRVPHPRFVGKTDMGSRGDAIVQLDWCVGEIYKTLEEEGLLENTMIVFSSDNGAVIEDGYHDEAIERLGDHDPSAGFRGGKYCLFEGGTRVPFIISWPNGIQAGQVSNALVSQMDFIASFAKLLNIDLGEEQLSKLDSMDTLDAFLGVSQVGRRYMIEEAMVHLAFRDGNWKYMPPVKKIGPWLAKRIPENGRSLQDQLYNLSTDKHEDNNIAEKYPEKVAEMKAKLAEIIANPNAQK